MAEIHLEERRSRTGAWVVGVLLFVAALAALWYFNMAPATGPDVDGGVDIERPVEPGPAVETP